jgi:uncharacterized protein
MQQRSSKSDSPHRVPLRQIPPDGLDLEFDLSGPFARQALAGTEVDPETAKLSAQVALQRVAHDVFVRGRVMGTVTLACSRCTKDAALTIDAPFELTFVPPASDGRAGDAEEVELLPDELDVVPYDGEAVELGDALREQLLLSFPLAPLCQESCKGLCATCGHDLNEGPCECPPEPAVPDRWAALKNVKL